MVTAQPAEAPRGLPQAGGDPPDEHAAVAPAAHVTDEMADEPVEVLDRVRTPECPVQRAGDPETLERERLIQPFAQGGRGAWMRVIEGRRELQGGGAWQAWRLRGRTPRRARGGPAAASSPGDAQGRSAACAPGSVGRSPSPRPCPGSPCGGPSRRR